jgi:hypothetical protein
MSQQAAAPKKSQQKKSGTQTALDPDRSFLGISVCFQRRANSRFRERVTQIGDVLEFVSIQPHILSIANPNSWTDFLNGEREMMNLLLVSELLDLVRHNEELLSLYMSYDMTGRNE